MPSTTASWSCLADGGPVARLPGSGRWATAVGHGGDHGMERGVRAAQDTAERIEDATHRWTSHGWGGGIARRDTVRVDVMGAKAKDVRMGRAARRGNRRPVHEESSSNSGERAAGASKNRRGPARR